MRARFKTFFYTTENEQKVCVCVWSVCLCLEAFLSALQAFVLRWIWQSGSSYLQEVSPSSSYWGLILCVVSWCPRPANWLNAETTASTSTWVPDDTVCPTNTDSIDVLWLSITIPDWMSNMVNIPERSKGTWVVCFYCSSTRAHGKEGNHGSQKRRIIALNNSCIGHWKANMLFSTLVLSPQQSTPLTH